MTQPHRVAATLLVLALASAACGSQQQTGTQQPAGAAGLRDRIQVTGDFGARPTIKFSAPLTVPETVSWTTKVGDGDKIRAASTSILALTLADGRTGKTAISTHDKGQGPLEVKLDDQVFPALARALMGQPARSRVVVASTSEDAYRETGAPQIGIKPGDPVVMVADVLSADPTSVLDGPTGSVSPPPAGAPRLQEQDGVPSGFAFPSGPKPTKLSVIALRAGTGPKVGTPDRITADYIGQVWGAADPFNNTYGKEPAKFSIGLSGVIKAWDRGLAGQREGARVMLVCPPGTAYGSTRRPGIPAGSTLVFVVDVLGVG